MNDDGCDARPSMPCIVADVGRRISLRFASATLLSVCRSPNCRAMVAMTLMRCASTTINRRSSPLPAALRPSPPRHSPRPPRWSRPPAAILVSCSRPSILPSRSTRTTLPTRHRRRRLWRPADRNTAPAEDPWRTTQRADRDRRNSRRHHIADRERQIEHVESEYMQIVRSRIGVRMLDEFVCLDCFVAMSDDPRIASLMPLSHRRFAFVRLFRQVVMRSIKAGR